MYEQTYWVLFKINRKHFRTETDHDRWAAGEDGYDDALGRYTSEEEAIQVMEILKRTDLYQQRIVDLEIRKMTPSQMVEDYCKYCSDSQGLYQMAEGLFGKCQDNLFYPEAMINVDDDPSDGVEPQTTEDLESYLQL